MKKIIIVKSKGKPDQVNVVGGKPSMSGQPAEVKAVKSKSVMPEQPVMKLVPEKDDSKKKARFLKIRTLR